jgi:hypothetical protein
MEPLHARRNDRVRHARNERFLGPRGIIHCVDAHASVLRTDLRDLESAWNPGPRRGHGHRGPWQHLGCRSGCGRHDRRNGADASGPNPGVLCAGIVRASFVRAAPGETSRRDLGTLRKELFLAHLLGRSLRTDTLSLRNVCSFACWCFAYDRRRGRCVRIRSATTAISRRRSTSWYLLGWSRD